MPFVTQDGILGLVEKMMIMRGATGGGAREGGEDISIPTTALSRDHGDIMAQINIVDKLRQMVLVCLHFRLHPS